MDERVAKVKDIVSNFLSSEKTTHIVFFSEGIESYIPKHSVEEIIVFNNRLIIDYGKYDNKVVAFYDECDIKLWEENCTRYLMISKKS